MGKKVESIPMFVAYGAAVVAADVIREIQGGKNPKKAIKEGRRSLTSVGYEPDHLKTVKRLFHEATQYLTKRPRGRIIQ